MLDLKILRLSSIVLISLSSCLCASAPPNVQVLSPSEFDVILAPDEKGTLLDVRVNINKRFGSGGPEYQKKNVAGRVIRFSERSLNLKRGDVIYYSMTFDDGDQGLHGEDGNYIFDGVYKRRDRRRREVYEPSSEESSENVNQDTDPKQGRFLRHGPPRGHFGHHPPPHHHFGPRQFFPPPFGVPHHPPPYPGHDPWKDHGYGHKDKFGNNGPWDHDEDDCDSFGHKPKYPGGEQRPDDRKPWRKPGESPFPDSNDDNSGSGKPSGEKPSKGAGSGTTTENTNVEVFTTSQTSTTSRTTTVPDIDIRFRMPEDS
ncbi:uncharacterized protein LOC108908618 [Anoplophora glabripennis]|uniref:uncharacterized protein LOC108908618 n=1 Tax=Anoplophora glabripennis TaxID=217634 RepID=UPI000875A2A4|nr:uncharacterized protein LOC108908618 [Anoplophora glabripennis]